MTEVSPQGTRCEPDPRKFRLLRRLPDGTVRRGGLELLDGEGQVWVDLTGPAEAEMASLARRFGLHPLAVEDCLHLDQRPKVEEYGDHFFLVQHTFTEGSTAIDLKLHELHAFLGNGWLITVHDDAISELDAVFERTASDPAVFGRGLDFVLYLVTDRIADDHFLLLDDIADAIDDLEDSILAKPRREDIQQIFALKRSLVTLRRTLSPARDAIGMLARRGDPRVAERTALYFRDVYDHLVRVNEAIDADRDLLGNALDAYLSVLANRTNDIMKQLTIFSVTFLPLTFITGFFGQNFTSIMPFETLWMFETMLALCIVVPVGMIAWFLRKRWL